MTGLNLRSERKYQTVGRPGTFSQKIIGWLVRKEAGGTETVRILHGSYIGYFSLTIFFPLGIQAAFHLIVSYPQDEMVLLSLKPYRLHSLFPINDLANRLVSLILRVTIHAWSSTSSAIFEMIWSFIFYQRCNCSPQNSRSNLRTNQTSLLWSLIILD